MLIGYARVSTQVSFSEDDCTGCLGVTAVVQTGSDDPISVVICTNLAYAQYSCAP